MKYTEADLYDGMMIIWVPFGGPYTNNEVYQWDAINHKVRSNRGKSSAYDGYPAHHVLKCMNDGHCYPETQEFIPLIFN